jgi:hypothetical protein
MGVGKLPFWAALLHYLMGGGGSVWHATPRYWVALTDRRFLALRIKAAEMKVIEEQSWPLAALPPVKASTNRLYTRIAVADPARPFKATFASGGMPGQGAEAQAIAAALTGDA